jgi:Fe-S-cluster-containing hydrogenase component 2
MVRKIIAIDEEKCDGCGECIPNCPEGAIKLVDGKARLTGEALCDGLGACLGRCPQGAITVTEREAAAYDESEVMKNMLQSGPSVVSAHLKHLEDHGEIESLKIAKAEIERARKKPAVPVSLDIPGFPGSRPGCPGSASMSFQKRPDSAEAPCSALTHWPIQLHLLNPLAPQFQDADVLLAADCTAFATGRFHEHYLKGRALAIACPKLDSNQDVYLQKLAGMMERSRMKSLTVMIMQVPCCGGLWQLALKARESVSKPPFMRLIRLGLQGEVLETRELAAT